MSARTYELDTLKIIHTVRDELTGGAKSLVDGSVLAIIAQPDGETFNGNAEVIDAAAGQIGLTFQPGTFDPTTYPYQIRVTDSVGDVQTVVDTSITASRSLRLFVPEIIVTPAFWGSQLTSALFYSTLPLGLAATADDGYFFVATQDGTLIELWRRVDGEAVAVRMEIEVDP